MAKQTPLINNFTAGELSPKVDVRSDIQKYFNGCRTMENFYPLIEGAAKRVPGTRYIGMIKQVSEIPANEVETYIELLSSGCCFPNQYLDLDNENGPLFDATYYATYRALDTADYDGNAAYTFEIICANVSEKNSGFAYLVDESDVVIATIEVSKETRGPDTQYSDGTGGPGGRYNYYVFSTTFAPIRGSHQYGLRTAIANIGIPDDGTITFFQVANARIIIHQSRLTKSVVHIPMMVLVNYCQMDWRDIPAGEHVITDGRETGGLDIEDTPNYSDCDTGNHVEECRQIWKYESTELSTLDKVVFDAGIGYLPLDVIPESTLTFYGVPTLTAIGMELRWCTTDFLAQHSLIGTFGDVAVSDGLGNTFNLVEDSYAEWIYSQDGTAWETTVYLDVTSLAAADGYYLYMCSKDNVFGGDELSSFSHWPRLRAFSIPVGRELDRAWIRYYYDYNEVLLRHEVKMSFDYELKPATINNGYVVLYDKTVGSYVSGSELIWDTYIPWIRKSVELDASLFTSGHEYQARWKAGNTVGATPPMVTDVNLWLKVKDITSFSSYLRVAKSTTELWRYGDVYLDWKSGYISRETAFYYDLSSRAKPFIPLGAKVYYECSISEINTTFSNNEYLRDVGITTNGVDGTNVDGSGVAISSEDGHTKRVRSGEISNMVDQNYYIVDMPGGYWGDHYMISGFIIVQQV